MSVDKNEMLLRQSASHVEIILKALLAKQSEELAWRYLLAWLDLVSPNQAAQYRMSNNAERIALLEYIRDNDLVAVEDLSALSRDNICDQLMSDFTPGSKLPELDYVKLSFAERIDTLGGELLGYLVGKKHIALDWPKTVDTTLELLTDVLNILPAGAQRPKWCTELHYEIALRYANVVRRIPPPRVKLLLPKMYAIQSLLNEYYRILPTLQEGVTEMSNGSELNDIHFAKQPPEGFANMSEMLKDPDVHIGTKISSDYGDCGVIVESPPRVAPPANLRKDPAYLLNINGCGHVAFRFKESPFGWINQLSVHIDIAGLDENVRDHVLEVLRSIIITPFENFECFEEDSIIADNQLAEFINEVEAMDVVERPMYSNGVFFISIIPTVRQSWDVEEHEKPV